MFCLGGGGARQIYKLTIKLEVGAFRLHWDGPAWPGLTRSSPAREGPSIRALRGPNIIPGTTPDGGGYINQELILLLLLTTTNTITITTATATTTTLLLPPLPLLLLLTTYYLLLATFQLLLATRYLLL